MTPPDRRPRDADVLRRRQIRIGLAGVVVGVVIAIVAAVVYTVPFGTAGYRADFSSSGQLHPGDEVRVASITVGEVQSVQVVGDHVEIGFSVDDSVRLGDATRAEIRLLTAIGGHYLAVLPQGNAPLRGHITATTAPYELTDVIADSGAVVGKTNAATAQDTFTAVNQALRGRSGAVRQIIAQISDVTDTLGDNQADLDRAIRVTDEYVGTLDAGRAKLVNLLRLVGLLGYRFYEYRADTVATINGVGALFAFLQPPIDALDSTITPQFDKIVGIVDTLKTGMARTGPMLDQLTAIATQLGRALGVVTPGARIDLSGTTITGTGLCVPTLQRRCGR
ncbi:MlaD family protein [Williamsia sp. CHRR-6]|uniref:MlaD family protein n=1 Tax=Williamsia sp. CHRR-6 TaxID=2835871 RepID=UPI001BDAE488|nr:MlaD family protein [Williamsia sp. CHRR-6]MBT0566574.1 MCE family protein [Williamsia sp. CHRR-6]